MHDFIAMQMSRVNRERGYFANIYGECVTELCEAELDWRGKSSSLIGQQQTNLFNRSSRVQLPRDICTRFGCYLYSTKCSWIIMRNICLKSWFTEMTKVLLILFFTYAPKSPLKLLLMVQFILTVNGYFLIEITLDMSAS